MGFPSYHGVSTYPFTWALLGGLLGELFGLLEPYWGGLGAFGSIFSAILRHLSLS